MEEKDEKLWRIAEKRAKFSGQSSVNSQQSVPETSWESL